MRLKRELEEVRGKDGFHITHKTHDELMAAKEQARAGSAFWKNLTALLEVELESAGTAPATVNTHSSGLINKLMIVVSQTSTRLDAVNKHIATHVHINRRFLNQVKRAVVVLIGEWQPRT
ncbi:hypothetical protein H4R26_000386 [Coemansia thaxteri]|uniref:Uncharacterized protein n=1 Tax=Coemansia thaxteri TaxID=2663907 RepID=A0A9W8EM62_9FUNG|nr:hypothetical protein H4R26_000386 [Coemansia thaxteri]KAJ2487706.1 hypothetical protein EV174_000377 [Coemansia sp. RSA 2320]